MLMAAINLVVTIPDDAALQARMLDAINWMHRTEQGDVITPGNLTGAQAKAFLEQAMKRYARNRIESALREKAAYEAGGWQI